ncbi:MAG TPA: hypothetical protein VE685_18355 [Thermoanaerobaculia bacterium]|nr:hypothetical protein [Thermoanaerobaculia bacterium]
MKTRLILAFAVVALTLGIAQMAPASSGITPKECEDLCSRVRCASPTVCGLYIDASGERACGCH